MIRILQVVNNMHRAGLETMLMNYYRNIDRDKIQFDFLTHRPEKSDYDEEIVSLGGNVDYAPRLYPQNYPAYFKWMKNFWKEHPEYRIVHSHIDAMSYLPLLTAKEAGIPVRIAHSHNTSIDRDFKYLLKQYFRSYLTKVANYYMACGEEAGRFLFGNKKFKILPNAIEAEKFIFSQEVRMRKRDELGLNGKFVIGHVGRFSYQKNQKFLIKIFEQIHLKRQNAILILVGVGEKEKEIRKLVKAKNLNKYVLFLGKRNDVNELYQAMDVFVMPSFFEGIPVVGIEAQFADLPCVFSDKVPKEVKFNNNISFISLMASAEKWASQIVGKEYVSRGINKMEIKNSRYNIKTAFSILENYYFHFQT